MELTTRLLQFEWIGGPRLPSTVAYFAGELRNEIVNWSVAPKTMVMVLEMSESNPETPVKLGGDSSCLSATATGFEATDGTNTASLSATWDAGETQVIALQTDTYGEDKLMRIVRY